MDSILSQVQDKPAHERRVLTEFLELQEKHRALRTFLSSRLFDELETVDQNLLHEQHRVMGMYLGILENRISRFSA